jgi:hypothetical protein
MKLSKLQRMTMAIAAAGLLLGGVAKAISTELSAVDFIKSVSQSVERGDIQAAKVALSQILELGIKQIRIGKTDYLIVDILLALDDPIKGPILLTEMMKPVNLGSSVYFVAENRTVATVNWTPATTQLFPTGSAG